MAGSFGSSQVHLVVSAERKPVCDFGNAIKRPKIVEGGEDNGNNPPF